jgi:excinuclease ABC subunit C
VQALVRHIARIEVTLTNSETEALLLEYNLIKEHKPRYNIVLRDDKSFPYIYLPSGHEFPRLVFYRGARNLPGGISAVSERRRRQGNAAERAEDLPHPELPRHLLRQPQPPCLQHQIGRCSAPCVKLIRARTMRATSRRREGARRPQRRSICGTRRAMEQAAERCSTNAPRRCAISWRRSSRCRPSRSSPPRAIATSTCSRWSASPANSR